MDVRPVKCREIVGAAQELSIAMTAVERQWREDHPALAAGLSYVRGHFVHMVNAALRRRGADPLPGVRT